MFTRIQTLVKGLPWRPIVYAIAVAIWSIGWGVGAAVVYCHRELGGHLEAGRIYSKTHMLSTTSISLEDEKGKLFGWIDADCFYWVKGDASARIDADEFRWEKGNTSARLHADGFVFTRRSSGVSLSFDEDGNPSVTLSDPAGKDRLVLGSAQTIDTKSGAKRTAPVSSMTLFGKDGMVIKRIE